jgi:alpha-1,2-mannosyltransferase
MAATHWSARLRPYEPVAVGLLAYLAGTATATYDLWRHGFPDFVVFWTAARHAADPLLYNSAHLTAAQSWWPGGGPRPFVYPPTFLLLAYPFGLLPFGPAYSVWVGLSCATFALAARLIVKPTWAAVILPLCLPVMIAAAYGQSVLFAGACLVGGVALIERRPRLAGVLIAAAVCIKPQLTILSPILMIGHWRVALAAIVAGVVITLASFVFGPGHWLEWVAALPGFAAAVHALPLKFVNLLDQRLNPVEQVLIAATGVAFATWCARRSTPEQIVGVIGGSLCCTFYAVRPDLALLAPSALAWVLAAGSLAGWLRRIAGALLLLGLIGSPVAVALFMAATAAAPAIERASRYPPRQIS